MFETVNYQAAAIAVAFTAACSYFDLFNKRNIPEKLLFAFLGASAVASFILNGQELFIQGAMQSVIIAGLGYLAYRAGQLGLADVFVLCSIAIIMPAVNLSADWGYAAISFSVPAVLLVFFVSVISFSYIMATYYFVKVMLAKTQSAKKIQLWLDKKVLFVVAAIVFFVLAHTFANKLIGMDGTKSIIGATFPVLMLFFGLFMPEIKDSMIEDVEVGKLELEDVVAVEKMDGAFVKKHNIGKLIDDKNLMAIKKSGLKRIPVYTGMPPFLPFILIGLLVVILFNNYIAGILLPAL